MSVTYRKFNVFSSQTLTQNAIGHVFAACQYPLKNANHKHATRVHFNPRAWFCTHFVKNLQPCPHPAEPSVCHLSPSWREIKRTPLDQSTDPSRDMACLVRIDGILTVREKSNARNNAESDLKPFCAFLPLSIPESVLNAVNSPSYVNLRSSDRRPTAGWHWSDWPLFCFVNFTIRPRRKNDHS
jgi:hypothetical protein